MLKLEFKEATAVLLILVGLAVGIALLGINSLDTPSILPTWVRVAFGILGAGSVALALVLSRRKRKKRNKDLACRFYEDVINARNLSAADKIFDPECVFTELGVPEPLCGINAWKQSAASFLDAFPDLHVTRGQMIAEGDKVAARLTWRGTHRETGKKVTVSGTNLFRIVKKRIVEAGCGGMTQIDPPAVVINPGGGDIDIDSVVDDLEGLVLLS